jgi:heme-degrading monooxygenase HmoA
MTAYNVVRMRVKPGREKEFLASFSDRDPAMAAGMKANGLRKLSVIKTGDRAYCLIGEWDNMNGIAAARPDMIKNLDQHRDKLEDLGGALGVTDPVSGEVVAEVSGA